MQNDVNVYPTPVDNKDDDIKNGFFLCALQSESANNKLQLAMSRLKGKI
jgi:hypothetical protein